MAIKHDQQAQKWFREVLLKSSCWCVTMQYTVGSCFRNKYVFYRLKCRLSFVLFYLPWVIKYSPITTECLRFSWYGEYLVILTNFISNKKFLGRYIQCYIVIYIVLASSSQSTLSVVIKKKTLIFFRYTDNYYFKICTTWFV